MSNSPSSHPPAAVDSLEGKLAVDNDKALRDMQETFMRTLDKAGDNKHQAFKKWLEHERIQNTAQNGYGINWAGIDSILSDEERRTFA